MATLVRALDGCYQRSKQRQLQFYHGCEWWSSYGDDRYDNIVNSLQVIRVIVTMQWPLCGDARDFVDRMRRFWITKEMYR